MAADTPVETVARSAPIAARSGSAPTSPTSPTAPPRQIEMPSGSKFRLEQMDFGFRSDPVQEFRNRHRELAGESAPNAGSFRTTPLERTVEGVRVRTVAPAELEAQAAATFKDLENRNHLQGLNREEFVKGMA